MAKLLVLYGTTEGQTRKIAAFAADKLTGAKHEVRLIDAADAPGTLTPEPFDGVIVAASLHIHKYQSAVQHWVSEHAAELNTRPCAFVSVSLAAAATDEDERHEALECAEAFFEKTGWRPKAVHNAAGALRYTKYDFLKTWIMKRIAKSQGGSTDTGHDTEYTDWTALELFVTDFAAAIDD